jgi:hypothetical protein
MLPLLPAQEGCQGSIEPAPRENLIDDLDVCGLVPKSAGWASSDQGNGYAREDRGDGWASCEYDAPPVMGFVFASRHPVSTDDAPDVVAHQFGAGFITEEISGRPVYLNPCVEPDPNCSAAIAVSAEPLLVILVPDEHNSAEELRTWAELVIDSLAARNSD